MTTKQTLIRLGSRWRGLTTCLVLVLLAFVFTTVSRAQDQADAPAPQTAAPQQSPTLPSLRDIVKVNKVYNLEGGKAEAGLNDIIVVEVENLEALLLRSKCQKPYDQDCTPKSIVLYLDGRPVKGLEPESGAPTLAPIPSPTPTPSPTASPTPSPSPSPSPQFLDGTLRYHLQRDTPACAETNTDCKEYWSDILGLSTDLGQWKWKRPVEVSVGLSDEYPVRTQVKPGSTSAFSLIRVRSYRILFWLAFVALCIILVIWLAKKYDLLSDRAPVLWKQKKPFSLSACQAAWWFIVILLSFVFIWLVTGQYDLSTTALVLLGIGSGTALTATVMDSSKRTESSQPQMDTSELNRLLSQKDNLEKVLTKLEETGPKAEFDTTMATYTAKIEEIRQKFPKAIGPPHERFDLDILSDSSGANFHRLQMLIWTIVLGVFFAATVLRRLSMPEFSTTLLTLMGISAGTFLTFKANENKVEPAPAVTPPPGDAGGGENKPDEQKPDEQPPPGEEPPPDEENPPGGGAGGGQ